jgi:hypothetical protein
LCGESHVGDVKNKKLGEVVKGETSQHMKECERE